METIIIGILEIMKYSMLISAITSVLYIILSNNGYRISFITSLLIYILLFVIMPKHIPYLWSKLSFISSGILASLISVIIGTFLLIVVLHDISLSKGLVFNWAVYSTQVYIFYINTPNKPIFDYPSRPTVYNEFWSFFTWSFLEANNLLLTIGSGLVLLFIVKLFRKINSEYFNKKCTDIT